MTAMITSREEVVLFRSVLRRVRSTLDTKSRAIHLQTKQRRIYDKRKLLFAPRVYLSLYLQQTTPLKPSAL